MRVFFLTALTMVAFASNSLLNRIAVGSAGMEPLSFAVIRVAAGALTLIVLARLQGQRVPLLHSNRWIGAGSLTVYMIGFSLAYLSLDAGLGALILFGVVQITMFGFSWLTGTPALQRQVIGAGVAFAGLVWVLWPAGKVQVDALGSICMIVAGIGWGFYTLAGRREPQALAATAANFCIALPLTLLAYLMLVTEPGAFDLVGILCAVISGAVTSGLGYALWYRLMPGLTAPTAATIQLSVPVIALLAGGLLLGEQIGPKLILGTILVVSGIAYAVRPNPKTTPL